MENGIRLGARLLFRKQIDCGLAQLLDPAVQRKQGRRLLVVGAGHHAAGSIKIGKRVHERCERVARVLVESPGQWSSREGLGCRAERWWQGSGLEGFRQLPAETNPFFRSEQRRLEDDSQLVK
jgi:hypothetical protein